MQIFQVPANTTLGERGDARAPVGAFSWQVCDSARFRFSGSRPLSGLCSSPPGPHLQRVRVAEMSLVVRGGATEPAQRTPEDLYRFSTGTPALVALSWRASLRVSRLRRQKEVRAGDAPGRCGGAGPGPPPRRAPHHLAAAANSQPCKKLVANAGEKSVTALAAGCSTSLAAAAKRRRLTAASSRVSQNTEDARRRGSSAVCASATRRVWRLR